MGDPLRQSGIENIADVRIAIDSVLGIDCRAPGHRGISQAAAATTRNYGLTPHEMRILKLLISGENYKRAAAIVGVTTHSISFHVRRIYETLHVHSRTEAVAKALRGGLFD